MKLNGKVAWVVGASSGIGAAVARELERRGATVAISARRQEQLREVSGGHMLIVPLDVTDVASVVAAAARVHEQLGPVDLAVLSAGSRLSAPAWVRTGLTAGNRFPMPFIIEAGQAARSICDGLEHDRTEIVFPAPMALLMKTARLVPARAWTALWARTSLT
jgi:NAD(P)-dependent dehydrogenase (short-subunit alcohol dehydrogenase family)